MKPASRRSLVVALGLAAAAVAFSTAARPARGAPPDGTAPAAAATDPAAAEEARALYASTCSSCHGADGRGDGVAATGLPKKPASFSDPAWQKTISDDEIARAIVGGGASVGKSPLMPPNPQLRDKPAVVAALRAMIRGFGATSAGG